MTDLDGILLLTNFAKRYPDLGSEQQLRWQYFKRNQNGLADAGAMFKGPGNKVYVNLPKYRDWLLSSATD